MHVQAQRLLPNKRKNTIRAKLHESHFSSYLLCVTHVTIIGITALHPTIKQHRPTENLPHATFPFAGSQRDALPW